MKIEIVTDTYHPDVNGVAMTLGRLVKGIKEKGHEVHVMHTALGDAAEGRGVNSFQHPERLQSQPAQTKNT